MLLSSLLLAALPLFDVSGIAVCGELVQGSGCTLFTFDHGRSFLELQDPKEYQAGDRIWVEGVWASTPLTCDPYASGVIYAGARLRSTCPVETFCGCEQVAPCGNRGQVQDLDSAYGCGNSAFSSGASLGLSFPGNDYSISSDQLGLQVSSAVPNSLSIVFLGDRQVQLPFGDGFRCVTTSRTRLYRLLPRTLDGVGALTIPQFFSTLSVEVPATQAWVTPGTTLYLQAFFQDLLGPCGSGWNLTNGLAITPIP